MPTKERIQKVDRVLSSRLADLRIVLEEVTNTHNASAVARTCDAAGIMYLDVISSGMEPLPVNKAISTRAEKWLHFSYYSSTKECLSLLKKEGFQVVATRPGDRSSPYTEINYAQPIALVFGNEAEGISMEALELADQVVKIPMVGMVQSLNLSVSVGILLYEALRQREAQNYAGAAKLSQKEFDTFRKKWLNL